MARQRAINMPKIGDIIEIPTRKGLGYAQYTHEHTRPPRWGSLVRVLPGLFREPPSDFTEISGRKELFFVFTPLKRILRDKIFRVVGSAPIPAWAVPFPLFRVATIVDGKVLNGWCLWDGEREWKVGELTPEMLPLSFHQMSSAEDIMARIEIGWKAEDEGVRSEDELAAAVEEIVRLGSAGKRAGTHRSKKPWFQRDIDRARQVVRMEPAKALDYPMRDDYLVGSTVAPSLLEAFHFGGGVEPSQLSGFGESFCYLKIDGTNGLDGSVFADRSQIEDALDGALRAGNLGCVLGGGTGLRYSYVDFAIIDPDRACKTIRTVLQTGRIPKRAWILFFDQDKLDRKIGIWDDTPDPP